MKNILSILIVFVSLVACEEDRYTKPDIAKVPIYQLQEYNSNGIISTQVNVYKSKDLVTRTEGPSIRAADISNRVDATDTTNYDIDFNALEIRDESVVIMAPLYDDNGKPVVTESGDTTKVETQIIVEATYNYIYDIEGTVKDSSCIARITGDFSKKYLGDNPDYKYFEEGGVDITVDGKMMKTEVFN